MDMADAVSGDSKEKGNRLKDLRGIPIIGSFAETKGDEVLESSRTDCGFEAGNTAVSG